MRPRGIPLLAVVLVLGLCALVEGQKPSACQCSRMTPENRKNCGFPGITSDECFDNGCCFDSSVGGVPWCFHPLPNQDVPTCGKDSQSLAITVLRDTNPRGFSGHMEAANPMSQGSRDWWPSVSLTALHAVLPRAAEEQCVMEVSARKDCGYPGISPEECASRKCCFSDLVFEVPWCFFPQSVEGKWLQTPVPVETALGRSPRCPRDNSDFQSFLSVYPAV
ncbi:hypothetical protein ACRRTK_022216 [Alexandromys fortis]